jgi:hypothetical protein
VRRLPISLRLRHGGRRAIVFEIDGADRAMLVPVTVAAMLSGAILCAADVPPTIADASVAGYGLLGVSVWLLRRLVCAS